MSSDRDRDPLCSPEFGAVPDGDSSIRGGLFSGLVALDRLAQLALHLERAAGEALEDLVEEAHAAAVGGRGVAEGLDAVGDGGAGGPELVLGVEAPVGPDRAV